LRKEGEKIKKRLSLNPLSAEGEEGGRAEQRPGESNSPGKVITNVIMMKYYLFIYCMKRSLIQFCLLLGILCIIKLKSTPDIKPNYLKNIDGSAFVGSWDWKQKGKSLEFGIDIKQVADSLTGQLCGITLNGKRIDCATDDDRSFSVPLPTQNSFICTFTSAYSMEQGTASITLDGQNLIWKIIKAPNGEYYFPKIARLTKTKAKHH
jgi:hypothetical protein